MINTIIFDLDGTLIDSIADLGLATNKTLAEMGYPSHPLTQYKQFVGNGVTKLIERALPDDHKDRLAEAKTLFYKYYDKTCLENTLPYPGIKDLLRELKTDYNLAVVTNKPHKYALILVNHFFPDTFTYIFGDQGLQPVKPDPIRVRLVMDLFDVKKENVVYIGDSDVDIVTGKNAKVRSIGCAWGFRGRKELEAVGADYVVDGAKEIKEVIDCWNK